MADVVFLNMVVSSIDDVLREFDQLAVYRSVAGVGGPYLELTTPSTRIPLTPGTVVYPFEDKAGDASFFYRLAYCNSVTQLQSSLSDPQQGQGDAALSVMSVSDLKSNYLLGLDLKDPDGVPFPDSLFEYYIKVAVSSLERRLDIPIRPQVVANEKHNYYPRDVANWCYVRLRRAPVASVQQFRLVMPGVGAIPQIFDPTTLMLEEATGVLQVIPGRFTGSSYVGALGYWPGNPVGVQGYIPGALRVDYTAGFLPGTVPPELSDLVAKMAAVGVLGIAGDLLGGAGIASSSISFDGLSQSISTTRGGENNAYGARTAAYNREIAEQVPSLRATYKGVGMVVP